MPGSLRIGQIAGIDIYINISWIIILVFQTWSLAISWFPAIYPHWSPVTYWITGLIAALLLFVSVLLHELAHSVVARARDLPVHNITLFIFGVVSYLILLPRRDTSSPVAGILGYLAITNVLLGIFNLIPGFPLDGGRVLRSIIWRITGSLGRATRAATITGEIVAYLFILAGIWLFFTGDFIGGIWIGFIGWFLMSSARSANSQVMLQSMLRGVKVSEVMNPAPATVPANISLQKLVYEHFLPQGLRSALVIQGDRLAGLITLSDIRHVPQEQWAQTPVGFAMIPRDRLHVVYPQQNLNDVLPLMANQDVNQLPVVQDERVVGVLSRDSIMRFLEIRRNLGIYSSRQAA